MIIKSYEIKKNISKFSKYNFLLLYGENDGLKKEIKDFIKSTVKQKKNGIEIFSFYENEILSNEANFFNAIYSESLFSSNKIIIFFEASDKIIK